MDKETRGAIRLLALYALGKMAQLEKLEEIQRDCEYRTMVGGCGHHRNEGWDKDTPNGCQKNGVMCPILIEWKNTKK